MQIPNDQMVEILSRVLHNVDMAKSFIEAGQEIFCGRRIDAIKDQLHKLIVVIQTPEDKVPEQNAAPASNQ